MDTIDKDVEMEEETPEAQMEVDHEQEDYLTSGFAKHSEKDKIIETFNRQVWPALAAKGWTTVRRAFFCNCYVSGIVMYGEF
jgi:hypothetical protein